MQAVQSRQNGLKQTDTKRWKLICLHSELNCSLSYLAMSHHHCPALPTHLSALAAHGEQVFSQECHKKGFFYYNSALFSKI